MGLEPAPFLVALELGPPQPPSGGFRVHWAESNLPAAALGALTTRDSQTSERRELGHHVL